MVKVKCICGGNGKLIKLGGVYSVRCDNCGRRTGEYVLNGYAEKAWEIMNGVKSVEEKKPTKGKKGEK